MDNYYNYDDSFKDKLDYVIKNLYHFDDNLFENCSLYNLILESFRKVHDKVFIHTPDIFNTSMYHFHQLSEIKSKRLDYYKISFDIKHYVSYLKDIIEKNKNSLDGFTSLDKPTELMNLIVDNYIAMMIDKVNNINKEDLDSEIRNIKLNKIL